MRGGESVRTLTRELLEKFQKMEMRISRERGPFNLFALFLPEDAANLWDLVISAPWADDNESEALRYMVRELQKDLTTQEILRLSRTVFIPTWFDELEELYEEHPVEHGKVILRNREFGLQFVEKGYIITCRPPTAKAA
jgi:hypothetical protein